MLFVDLLKLDARSECGTFSTFFVCLTSIWVVVVDTKTPFANCKNKQRAILLKFCGYFAVDQKQHEIHKQTKATENQNTNPKPNITHAKSIKLCYVCGAKFSSVYNKLVCWWDSTLLTLISIQQFVSFFFSSFPRSFEFMLWCWVFVYSFECMVYIAKEAVTTTTTATVVSQHHH